MDRKGIFIHIKDDETVAYDRQGVYSRRGIMSMNQLIEYYLEYRQAYKTFEKE